MTKKTKTARKKMSVEAIADWVLRAEIEFDRARDMDGNPVSKIKFCMISEQEWDRIRALAFVAKSVVNATGIKA